MCGIVPDGTFPAELTLGRQAIHKLGIYYIINSENIQLLALDGKPTLCPLKQCTVWLSVEEFLKFPETEFRNQYFATLADSLNFSLEPSEKIKRDKLITLVKTKFHKLFDIHSLAGATSKATSFLHDIDIKDPEIPIKCAPRRYSPAQERFINEYVDASIKSNFIKKSNSQHASPAHIVGRTKPERFAVDYRKLNEKTIKDAYPLPNVKDQIQTAAGHRFYIKFDLKSGFYHTGLTERAKQLSVFVVPSGHYEYLVMPFGLTNVPATFQRVVDEALLPVRDITSNLIDDVLTWGDSLDEAYRNAVAVLQRFDILGFRLNSRK
ncbi:Enzymatic polyprotein [Golovinomyces cichoracearum]|uniref:Enzymatic polyprotein n=1 Tax=Golovinomyces cichoracearum TaxID=62708 RepID=A0A420H9B8_9PEZI|nr:Enzymatic polyprotein [Golovinomyces cichoracearum]